jgi:hypothetical protein
MLSARSGCAQPATEGQRPSDPQYSVRDENLGWFPVDNEGIHSGLPRFHAVYRDETSWALVPDEMKQASAARGLEHHHAGRANPHSLKRRGAQVTTSNQKKE